MTKLRKQIAPLCVILIGLTIGCGKTAPVYVPAKAGDGPEFQDISDRARVLPTFSIKGEIKEIRLDILALHFDDYATEGKSRTMPIGEWEDLRHTLENGIEVSNEKNLAISADIGFLDNKGEVIGGVILYWTSQTGDVYFGTGNRWFKVSDRAAVLSAIRGKSTRPQPVQIKTVTPKEPFEWTRAEKKQFVDKLKTVKKGDKLEDVVKLLGPPFDAQHYGPKETDEIRGIRIHYWLKKTTDGVNELNDQYVGLSFDRENRLRDFGTNIMDLTIEGTEDMRRWREQTGIGGSKLGNLDEPTK